MDERWRDLCQQRCQGSNVSYTAVTTTSRPAWDAKRTEQEDGNWSDIVYWQVTGPQARPRGEVEDPRRQVSSRSTQLGKEELFSVVIVPVSDDCRGCG